MRELLPVNISKLKEEDRRFLMERNASEILFYDQMLMNNKVMVITIFALFTSLVSLVVSVSYISTLAKILFVCIMSLFTIYLLITFFRARRNISHDYNRIKKDSSILFNLHFDYAKNKGEKNNVTQ